MGKVFKDVVLAHGAKVFRSAAKIDSGADVTLLSAKDALAIGFDPCIGRSVSVSGIVRESVDKKRVTSTRLVGPEFLVDVQIDARRAQVVAVVPLWVLTTVENRATGKVTTKETDGRRAQTLIGHDFLQAAKAKLDFSMPHGQAFSGLQDQYLGPSSDWVVQPVSRAEQKTLRKLSKCPRRSR